MENYMLISDAARQVQVESHVLRYWEEELKLPIKRNEWGHRYYGKEDVERFKQIKEMKESGLQLKAIRMILKDGNLSVCDDEEKQKGEEVMPIRMDSQVTVADKGEKVKRLQWLLQQMMKEAIQENNEILLKELDYQFRLQEEREEEREREQAKRTEEYYQRIDGLLRGKREKKWQIGGHKKRKQTP